MKTLVIYILVAIGLAAGADAYVRYRERTRLGPGCELRPGQLIKVVSVRTFDPAHARSGERLQFRVVPSGPLGSTAIGDGLFKDAFIEAQVTDRGYSGSTGHRVATFRFDAIQFARGKRYDFKGSVFSEDDPQHLRESGMLGSFAAMEMGPLAIVGGFLVGTTVPYYYGRNFAAPLNYAVAKVEAGTEIYLKVHFSEYIPFDFGGIRMVPNGRGLE